jgi:signal transduction histidine kinase
MREALSRTYQDLWRQAEEHKRLNAASTHNLRLPLTVIKGRHEMLQLTASQKDLPSVTAMGTHIRRLEQYADSMNRLQRLEEAVPEKQKLKAGLFFASLEESARLLCQQGQRILVFSSDPCACERQTVSAEP